MKRGSEVCEFSLHVLSICPDSRARRPIHFPFPPQHSLMARFICSLSGMQVDLPEQSSLKKLRLTELRALCQDLNVTTAGTKDVLIQRLESLRNSPDGKALAKTGASSATPAGRSGAATPECTSKQRGGSDTFICPAENGTRSSGVVAMCMRSPVCSGAFSACVFGANKSSKQKRMRGVAFVILRTWQSSSPAIRWCPPNRL
jgi:hypothetical protein